MKKIAVIYTSLGPLVNHFHKILTEAVPGVEIIRVADDSLIRDVQKRGKPDENIEKRTFLHIESVIEAGAEMVIIACSSVGELAPKADARYDVPVIRIDDAMMNRAVHSGEKVGVVATLQTTIEPTVAFLLEKAKAAGKDVQVISRVAEGAYQALNAGDVEKHDALVTEAAKELEKETDVVILAQGSMARLLEPLSRVLSVPVLTSPETCADAVKEMVKQEEN